MGGYLPFSAELTGYLQPGDNVLAVIVDGRCGPVPAAGRPGRPGAPSTSCSRAGSTAMSGCGCVPGTYLSDVFAQPVNVLTAQPERRHPVHHRRGRGTDRAGADHGRTVRAGREGIRTIATTACTLDQVRAGQTAAALSLTGLGDISLWSPTSPELYSLTTTVSVPGRRHAFGAAADRLPRGVVPRRTDSS